MHHVLRSVTATSQPCKVPILSMNLYHTSDRSLLTCFFGACKFIYHISVLEVTVAKILLQITCTLLVENAFQSREVCLNASSSLVPSLFMTSVSSEIPTETQETSSAGTTTSLHRRKISSIEDTVPSKKQRMSPTENQVVGAAPASHLLIKRLSDKARLPTRGSSLSAGYDLYRYVFI